MFKKALQVVTTFGLLLACYEGYVRGFAYVAESISQSRRGPIDLLHKDSETMVYAMSLAEKAFGKGHWTTGHGLPIRYYNKEKGYWMYAQNYKRLKDGKQILLEPFALIWQSRDGKDLKTAISQKAIIDVDQPIGIAPSGSATHVTHATLEGDVHLRDDKGTPRDLADDLRVGPLPYIEYDEPTLQIRSESDVVIEDRDMWINGFGLLITLWPKDENDPAVSGFNGAKSAFLRKYPHVIIKDVGRSGILPGTAKPEQVQGTKTPLDLRGVGEMRVDLPKPRLPVRVGPPAPALPTLVYFDRDVVVLRGKPGAVPDQLNCDHLKLVLLPSPKPPVVPPGAKPEAPETPPKEKVASNEPAEDEGDPGAGTSAGPEPAPASGPLTELALHRAEATGHAVWLRSESQGLKALGNELIFKKLTPEAPDETYFRGDSTKKLRVEKIDLVTVGPDKGKVQSVTTIWAIDATIFDNGQGNDNAIINARGPGLLETRPDRDKAVEHKAIWEDELWVVPVPGADKLPRKRITLTGYPKLIDLTQPEGTRTLDARTETSTIVAWLKPKPKPETPPEPAGTPATTTATAIAPTSTEPPPASASESFQVERLVALEDVHLDAPGQTMTARDRLDVEFDLLAQPTTVKADNAPAQPIAAPSPAPAPPSAPDPNAPATPPMPAPPAPKPAEPDVSVRANRVWARILQQPGQGLAVSSTQSAGAGGNKAQIQEVRLRGAVHFHQDPSPDKQRGTDVTGEALDVLALGEGKSLFKVFHQDPTDPKVRPNPLAPLAKVETEDFTIQGLVIGLNQKTDRAWVDHRGTLTQLTQRGLLSDKGLDNPPPDAKTKARTKGQPGPSAKQTPLTITWTKSMKFFGQPTDPRGPQVAHAEFEGDVRAEMEDGLLLSQKMNTYMDRTVKLTRPPKDDKAKTAANGSGTNEEPAEDAEPRPQIALIDCYGGYVGDEYRQVIAVNRKLDAESRVVMQQNQIEAEHVIYDKVTGNFLVPPGPGLVYLYNREGQDPTDASLGTPASATATAGRRTITPIADTNPPAANTRRATTVVGRNTNRGLAAEPSKAKTAQVKPKKKPLPPLKLTQIVFEQGMKGRFGTGKDTDKTETRWADFFGDVQVLNAQVASEKVTFDYDKPPIDGVFLTAQTLRVVSVPIPGDPKGEARNFLKAWENAQATTSDKTIQADIITYDSLNDLFYAYGTESRQVVIAQQGQVGQQYSTTGGDTVRYNHKTGESELINPSSTVELVDLKTGSRPGPHQVPEFKDDSKRSRAPFKKPGRSTTERKGFNGR